MLFHSPEFMFVFLPVTLCGFFMLEQRSRYLGMAWLLIASIVFYGYWDIHNVLILSASIAINLVVGRRLMVLRSLGRERLAAWVLTAGIAANLAALIFFKYLGFLWNSLHFLHPPSGAPLQFDLPLGISFFTFTQIAFLVDARRGAVADADPVRYGLFVTYFPHLIAGPIMHHADVMPQFVQRRAGASRIDDAAIGLAVFIVGMTKKIGLADMVGPNVGGVFTAAQNGAGLSGWDCWLAVICYTLQIYFDFSGYSDMAIGLSRMLGVRIPINFYSPYKASSIIEFWRRWHISLSTFLRDYLYFPLGGNRRGRVRRYVNLMLVMALGGLWHGANWTFVAWGALHGAYLAINHLWHGMADRFGFVRRTGPVRQATSILVTFLAVTLAWVPFRAANLDVAGRIWSAMFNPGTFPVPAGILTALGSGGHWLRSLGVLAGDPLPLTSLSTDAMVPLLLALVWFSPNSQQLFARFEPALVPSGLDGRGSWLRWAPNLAWTITMAIALIYLVFVGSKSDEFIYFKF